MKVSNAGLEKETSNGDSGDPGDVIEQVYLRVKAAIPGEFYTIREVSEPKAAPKVMLGTSLLLYIVTG